MSFPQGPGTTSNAPNAQDDFAADMSLLNADDGPAPEPRVTPPADDKTPPAKEDEEELVDETTDEDEHLEGDEEEESKEGEEEEEQEEPAPPTPISTRPRPTVKEITTKYPNFFKDFPDMKHAMFREQEYNKLFPTVEEARVAQTDASRFNQLSDLVTSGKPEDFQEFLKGVSDANGLDGMAINFLPSLYKTNRDLYFEVTQPIAASLIQNAFRNGKAGNENLMNAALVLSQWAFGDTGYATGEKKLEQRDVAAPKNEAAEVATERAQLFQEKYNDVQNYVSERGQGQLRNLVARGFDPNNALPDFTRQVLIDKVIQEIGEALEKDPRHMKAMNDLWKKAGQARFAGDWKDRLLTTFLSGAKVVMPAIRTRIRAAAIKDSSRASEGLEQTARRSADRREVRGSAGPPQPKSNRPPDARQIDWKNTSDLDILNDKVTLRK